MSISTSTRTYRITNEDKFTISSIGLLSSVKILPEEMFGILMEAPEQIMYINGVQIPTQICNETKTPNFFDFKFLREQMRKIDPYNDEESDLDNSKAHELYCLEQVLLSGELDAAGIYSLTDEEFAGSIFTPYAIIRFENPDNEFLDSLSIEETYYKRL